MMLTLIGTALSSSAGPSEERLLRKFAQRRRLSRTSNDTAEWRRLAPSGSDSYKESQVIVPEPRVRRRRLNAVEDILTFLSELPFLVQLGCAWLFWNYTSGATGGKKCYNGCETKMVWEKNRKNAWH